MNKIKQVLMTNGELKCIKIGVLNIPDVIETYCIIEVDNKQYILSKAILKKIALAGNILCKTDDDLTQFFVDKLYPHLSSINEDETIVWNEDDLIISDLDKSRVKRLCKGMNESFYLFSKIWFEGFLLKEESWAFDYILSGKKKEFIEATKNMKIVELCYRNDINFVVCE